MPNQVVYETNADFEATWKNLTDNPLIVAAVDRTEKGLLWFRFKGTSNVFMLSPDGRLQVRWENEEEKKVLFELVKMLLVPKGSTLTIKPSKQQVWIDYPPPENFKLYWCKEETEYLQKSKRVLLVTEEPIPIWLALAIKEKYPNVDIRTRKKSILERFRDFLNQPISLDF
ncbi:MAG: hypothetical protein QXH87_04815 [Candidatus Bathyarchaeia archaeon]